MQRSSLLDMYCISSCYSFLLHSPLALFRSAKRRSSSGPPPRNRDSEKCASEASDSASTTSSTEEETDALRRVSARGTTAGGAEGNPIIQLNGGDELKCFDDGCEVSVQSN
ncbi:hypothetical protein QR680_005179 [Steinernema hermaphroditum]|uniref:Uncharacterized protein n=1 Tax=Steinernema hermaphroditum TaxID=289476 RepID=A0AA39HSI9_9BILA|nr:hypothetical protein QR680_005179 [Steinernema hermaphroditum]